MRDDRTGRNGDEPPEPVPTVCVAIPAYRQESLRRCLESISLLADDGVVFEVHVVLNDVPDRIREIALSHAVHGVVVHDLPMNLGVAGSYNLAFAASRASYLLGLQDDSVVEAGLLRHLLCRLDSAPDIGAAAALVTDLDGQLWDGGWVLWGDGTAAPVWLGTSRDPEDFASGTAVPHHGTMGMLLRRTAWESIGGFDDAFYPAMYGDVDTCVALRRRGWRIVVEPLARARQMVNASTTPAYRGFLVGRHHQLLLQKHGEWLAQAPAASDDPGDIAREMARVAATPVRSAPGPTTSAERELLSSRLGRTPEQMLRRERDLLAEYRAHLEALRDAEAAAARAAEEHIDAVREALRNAEKLAAEAIADRDAARGETAAVHRELEAIALSRTWRWATSVRRVARRARRATR